MDNQILRKVQLTQLEIAKEFKRICEENNLIYMMESGTLLGAVRHKGFIPWDDDLDMSMPRDDYEKFLSIANEIIDPKYEIVNWREESAYAHPFCKIIKKNTVYKEEKDGAKDSKNGIYIDIFPYDVYPDDLKKGYIKVEHSCLLEH